HDSAVKRPLLQALARANLRPRPLKVLAYLAIALSVAGCAAPTGSSTDQRSTTPTPVTRAARTAAAVSSPTPIPRLPTAVIFADQATGRAVFPTPPPDCAVSAIGSERTDLGPTMGESPLWMASQVL